MKNLTLLLSTVCISVSAAFSQSTCNLVVFSDGGEPFYVVLNGLRQNLSPETNVRVTDLTNPSQRLKVIFEDTNLGEVSRNLPLTLGTETTLVIKKTKKGEYVIRANGMPVDLTTLAVPVSEPEVVYVPVYETPAPVATDIDYNTGTDYNTETDYNTGSNNTTTTTTTSTTTTTNDGFGTGTVNDNFVNVDMNMGGVDFGMDVNMGGTDMGMGTGTSTTTTTSTTVTSTQSSTGGGTIAYDTNDSYTGGSDYTDTYVEPAPVVSAVPGYSGTYGCTWPISDAAFNGIKGAVEDESFKSDRIMMAKQATKNKCLTVSQVKTVISLFTFEDNKLEYAKYAYDYTYDLDNYYDVNSAFTFDSSKKDLNRYVQSK